MVSAIHSFLPCDSLVVGMERANLVPNLQERRITRESLSCLLQPLSVYAQQGRSGIAIITLTVWISVFIPFLSYTATLVLIKGCHERFQEFLMMVR